MGYNIGMLKYIIKAPRKKPINFFKYGIGFIAVWSFIQTLLNYSTLTIEVFVKAYINYIMTKYLPPTNVMDIILPILAGAVIAGLKWRYNVVDSNQRFDSY